MIFTSIKPMLLSVGKDSFDDENFLFEPKWDGWRMIVHKEGDQVRVYTKNGHHVSDQFPEIKQMGQAIKTHSAILDCEAICVRNGKPNFDDISYRGRLKDAAKIRAAVKTHPVSFVAFDILQKGNDDLTGQFLTERKKHRKRLISQCMETSLCL